MRVLAWNDCCHFALAAHNGGSASILTDDAPLGVATAETPPGQGQLSDGALLLARVAWCVVAALSIGLLAASLPRRVAELLAPRDPALRAAVAALGFSPGAHAAYNLAVELLGALGFFALAGLIFWRCSTSAPAIGISAILVAFGAALPGTSYALISNQPIWQIAPGFLQALGWMSMLVFAWVFPNGRFVPRFTRLLLVPWAVWVFGFFAFAGTLTHARPVAIAVSYAGWIAWFGTGVGAQVYRYQRVSMPRERQQTKWVVLGFAGALAGALAASVQSVLSLTTGQASSNSILYEGAAVLLLNLSALLIPLTIAIAILRHNLYDIDRLINRTLVYATLTVALAAVYGASVLVLQLLLQVVLPRQSTPPLVLVISTLLIAALFQPLRARVQRTIDRRFYRQRYDASATIARFGATLRTRVNFADISADLLDVASQTMRPEHVSLWFVAPPAGEPASLQNLPPDAPDA